MDTLHYVPVEVRSELRRLCISQPDVDAAWKVWSSAAEAGLLTAYKIAGGPCPQGDSPFLGRGQAGIRVRRVGGRARADDDDVATCESFNNSSLAPVILFRRRLRSVGDVLEGIKNYCFTTARWQALMLRWAAVCRQGPTGLVATLEPWRDWLPPDLHGFYKWVLDSLETLDTFVKGVVVARREAALASWKRWLEEDKSSRPYKWLRPDLVPPAPHLICPRDTSPGGSGVLVQPALIDVQCRKAWMPIFRREGRDPVSPESFIDFIGYTCSMPLPLSFLNSQVMTFIR